MSRRDRLVRWLVRHIPEPILASPERVYLNFACFCLGVAAFLGARPGSLLALWPRWVAYEWAAAMLLGGGFALVGYWRHKRSLARLGYMLILVATSVVGIGSIIVFGLRGVPFGIIMLCLALAKATRLLIGSAIRAAVLEAGRDRCRP